MSAVFRRVGLVAAGALLALGLHASWPNPAAAQGLFGALFGGLGWDQDRRPRSYAPRYERGPATAYAPNDYGRQERLPLFLPRRSERQAAPAEPRSSSVHCVRMCDGRYFPLPRSANGTRLDPVKVCSALCPAATTKVFNGGNMNYAVASDGTRYADLDNAFAFRERLVPDCSCTGQGPGGLAQIDVESDPTLRAGDIVVTASGPTVFRGSSQFPYKTADFTPIDDYRRINNQLREQLAELQVNAAAQPVLPPSKLEAEAARQRTQSTTTRRSRPVRRSYEARRIERDYPQVSWW